jgi:hypothetical protein
MNDKEQIKYTWFSIHENLPFEYQMVLMRGNNITSSGIYMDNIFYPDFIEPQHEKVTHWMPLPQFILTEI